MCRTLIQRHAYFLYSENILLCIFVDDINVRHIAIVFEMNHLLGNL